MCLMAAPLAVQIRLKWPNEPFMGRPGENGTSHSGDFSQHNMSCLHSVGESLLTNCCLGFGAALARGCSLVLVFLFLASSAVFPRPHAFPHTN